MKIIAVNIGVTSKTTPKLTNLDATKRAWKLNIKKCKNYNYVIGVENGNIVECFIKRKVYPDNTEPNRIEFDLINCSPNEINNINNYINSNNINLKGIVTKYID